MKTKLIVFLGLLLAGLVCFGPGCVQDKGTLTLNLTDDPADYEEVYITFTEVSVHKAGGGDGDDNETDADNSTDNETNAGWIIISSEEQGFDLLTLQDGAFDLLAQADLDTGKYTQIRLKITDALDESGDSKTYVKVDGVKYELTVPSGTKSGLKLTHNFNIEGGEETVLYIDFDAEKSVNETGNGEYKLKPTIKVLTDPPQS